MHAGQDEEVDRDDEAEHSAWVDSAVNVHDDAPGTGDATRTATDRAAPMLTGASRRASRRALLFGLVRASAAAAVILAAYFFLPLDRLSGISAFVLLPLALAGLAVAIGFEVRAILVADYPGIRALEALARDVPLFLALFASTYFVMATAEPAWFSERISRLDAMYFTVTVFTTVGFGDITGVSPEARAAITVQMVADLIVIGFGLRIIMRAIQERRAATHPGTRVGEVDR
jgi:hypothetical protein